jgi:hypothetical protein
LRVIWLFAFGIWITFDSWNAVLIIALIGVIFLVFLANWVWFEFTIFWLYQLFEIIAGFVDWKCYCFNDLSSPCDLFHLDWDESGIFQQKHVDCSFVRSFN